MLKRDRNLLIAYLGVPAAAATLVLGAWIWDIHKDRQHQIAFVEPVPLFAGSAVEACDERSLTKITTISPGDAYEVRRIYFNKNCMTVEVRSSTRDVQGFVIATRGVTVSPQDW